MKIVVSICVALLVVFALSVSVHCQDNSLVDNMKTADGDVISVDIPNSQIVIRSSEVMTFSVPLDADIIDKNGFGIQLSDVNVGNYVTVGYHDDKSGLHVMNSMEVAYTNE